MAEANPELKPGAISSLISSQWKELAAEEKAPFEEVAAADKARYARECEETGFNPDEAKAAKEAAKAKEQAAKEALREVGNGGKTKVVADAGADPVAGAEGGGGGVESGAEGGGASGTGTKKRRDPSDESPENHPLQNAGGGVGGGGVVKPPKKPRAPSAADVARQERQEASARLQAAIKASTQRAHRRSLDPMAPLCSPLRIRSLVRRTALAPFLLHCDRVCPSARPCPADALRPFPIRVGRQAGECASRDGG